ncbi:hypothetical protein JYU34_002324 [Plutella xylostella]|uniref:Cysteine/serine-rich nuclear protein N-terminal domain-containing protein n=1 Tax=Plutella xylostella TaxID=51655 RepID=A0ABQ7R1W6_PLUXY|nr:hypothetical protein JYU34_002324 [Plutella xylostella]
MEPSAEAVAEQPRDYESNSNNADETKDTQQEAVEEITENEAPSVKEDKKTSDSDINSEDINVHDQIDVNVNSNSQFYESSDSKIDYAVKIDDNDTLSDVEDIKTDSASADSEDSALGSLPPDAALTDREEEAQDREDERPDTEEERPDTEEERQDREEERQEREEVRQEREEGQDRSDGSDSGLGSETTEDPKLSTFGLELPCSSGLNNPESSYDNIDKTGTSPIDEPKVLENNETEDPSAQISKPLKSSLKRKCEDETSEEPAAKKKKEGIRFDNVTVYYFTRSQGFTCVPSQGGSTLGMEYTHSHSANFTLAEHALEQRRLHRQILQQLKNERHSLQGATFSSSEDSDTEEEASDISESELDLDSYYFLQPVPTRQRRGLLRAAGVRKIEGYEKDECRDIRTSREFCGCACKGACNPETCSCSLAGIKCQVDRLNFPCGCTRDGCSNTTGRIEFNPVRVRTHFIHTLMRIGLEKKNEEEAAKRQWAQAHAARAACMPAAAAAAAAGYEPERPRPEEHLRDAALAPRAEVETCVNAGGYSNMHCDINNAIPATQTNTLQPDLNYVYRENPSSHSSVNTNCNMHMGETSSHTNHADPYTSSILQGKGPPYSLPNTMAFENMQHNVQRFPCDLNYTYAQHSENHHFKGFQSFSASSFEEFAHNSHMTMFSHYGHMYSAEYLHKAPGGARDQLQYHQMTGSHYDMYKTSAEAADNKAEQQQYTTLMSLPYHANNKVQSVGNDENWFSHSGGEVEAPAPPPAAAAPAPPDPAAEPTENFGELIKKTMVESVSV